MPTVPVVVPGTYGKPLPERTWPQIVGFGYSANDVSSYGFNVQNPMQLGDVIFASFGSQQVGGPTISGLGATWITVQSQQNGSGAQVDSRLWMGRVLTPSTNQVISASWTNQGQFAYFIVRGLQGILLASNSLLNAGGGLMTAAAMKAEAPTGIVVAAGYARGVFSAYPAATGMTFHRVNNRDGSVGSTCLYYSWYRGENAIVTCNSGSKDSLLVALVS